MKQLAISPKNGEGVIDEHRQKKIFLVFFTVKKLVLWYTTSNKKIWLSFSRKPAFFTKGLPDLGNTHFERMDFMGNLLELKNGSDIRGIAIATAEQSANLTPETIRQIAGGLLAWSHKQNKRPPLIGIGRDSRLSGPDLADALIQELLAGGGDVIDFGLATTPAMFMATQFPEFNCDLGLMLTASHLPFFYNGIKIFSQNGGAEKEDISWILSHTETVTKASVPGRLRHADILTPYAHDLVSKIKKGMATTSDKPLAKMKILADAGNGAGGFFASQVLQALGADTTGSQFLDPDGHFPNHIPNPDNKEAMASIKAAVLHHKADLGVIFDTDVDRAALVTADGNVLNRNNLIALLSQIILAEHPGTRIVTNSPTTDHLKDFIENLGGIQVRYISGYRNVINKAIALNNAGLDCQLAIETSGHAAFKENYFLDDGAYVIAKILMTLPKLIKAGRNLTDLIADLKQPAETLERRLKITGDNYREVGEKVIAQLADYVSQIDGWELNPANEEGIRIKLTAPYGTGWFLLRMSLHEPLLVLQVENDITGNNQKVIQTLQPFFGRYAAVDSSTLTTN